MEIYFTSWAEAGIKTVESDDDKEVVRKRKNKKTVKKTDVDLNEKKSYDHKQVIFDESTWPDTKNPQPLSKAKL
jgi:DNA replication protein DnaD